VRGGGVVGAELDYGTVAEAGAFAEGWGCWGELALIAADAWRRWFLQAEEAIFMSVQSKMRIEKRCILKLGIGMWC
jgi:hypothetical protein